MTLHYRYEAKGIQAWILAADKLKSLRGGSALVDGIAGLAKSRAAATGGTFLYAAAGGGTIEFKDDAQLAAFAEAWPLILSRFAPGLQIVQAWAPANESELLRKRLREARNAPLIELPEAGPWTARSGRTGLPAAQKGDGGTLLDAGTAKRTDAAPANERVGPELVLANPDYRGDPTWTFVDDLHHRAWGDGAIAVIHADGNGIGQEVIKRAKADDLRKFAEALDGATKRAACAAVRWLVEARTKPGATPNGRDLPARPIVIGGDDFTFIVEAKHGLGFLERWLEAFEDESRQIPGSEGLTACGGLAIVRRGFPFATAHEIAETLCRRAKTELRKQSLKASALAFERVTTSHEDELARSDVYGVGKRGKTPSLAALRDLGGHAQKLPKGKLRQWIALPDSRPDAHELWDRTAQVATTPINGQEPDRETKAAWLAFVEGLPPAGPDRRQRVADVLTLQHLSEAP